MFGRRKRIARKLPSANSKRLNAAARKFFSRSIIAPSSSIFADNARAKRRAQMSALCALSAIRRSTDNFITRAKPSMRRDNSAPSGTASAAAAVGVAARASAAKSAKVSSTS